MSHEPPFTHPDLEVTRTQAPFKERVLYCAGALVPQVNLRVNNPDVGTLATSILTRVLMCKVGDSYVSPPLPSRSHVRSKLAVCKSKLGNFITTPEPYESVVEQYVGRKRRIYEEARLSLSRKDVNSKDATINPWVKPEKVPPTGAPRCIQSRNARHCLAVGSYIKHIEHRIYDEIAEMFGDGPTVMKGFNVQQVGRIAAGKWNSFKVPVAVGLDATKFDMHVSPEILQWEHDIYLKIYNGDPRLRRLLNRQMNNVARGYCADGKLKYKTKGKRCSGDMNTALGNCIIMCCMVYAYAHEKRVDIKLMNNGDDCVVFMESSDLSRFNAGLDEWFLEMGFRMVAEQPCFELCEIEFCQMHPVSTVNGWTMVRNIPKTLHKDLLSLIPLRNSTEMKEFFGAIGECGVSLTHGVPILSSFYRRLRELGTCNTKFGEVVLLNSGARMLAKGIDRVEDTITPEARCSVWKAWGILPDHQVALESYFATMVVEHSSLIVGDYREIPNPQLL